MKLAPMVDGLTVGALSANVFGSVWVFLGVIVAWAFVSAAAHDFDRRRE